jgi:KUP system potassium uptake protein
VLHECNVFLTVEFRDVPWVNFDNRVQCEKLAHNCWRVRLRYGFMNRPDVGAALELCGPAGLQLDPQQISYFLSREKIVSSGAAKSVLARWRHLVFAAMARNAGSVTDFFNIPINRVVEVGTRVEL